MTSPAVSDRLHRLLFAPVDIGCLVFVRIAFGAAMLWEVCRYFVGGWISQDFIEPMMHFTFYGFEWVRPWPGIGMYVHFAVLGLCALGILLGLFYRVATALFCVGFTYVFLLDEALYLNHFYLICLLSFLLMFVPANRAFSLDAWRRPELRAEVAPAWTMWLLRGQIGIAYFFGGIAKLNGDWFHGEPLRMWLAERTDFPVIGQFFHEEWMVYMFVFGGVLLDLLVVPLMLWKRTRLPAFLAATAFHLMNARLFHIGVFPWLMLAATVVFFPPETPRRLAVACRLPWAKARTGARTESIQTSSWLPGQRKIGGMLACYFAVQIALPLRHFAYPGNVNWTEEGHRFSWHMKLRGKTGDARFIVTDPPSRQLWIVKPDEVLSDRQLAKVATHPDMILQFSHFLAEQHRQAGYPEVEVRAEVTASLNGRPPQPLVDSKVDLAKEQRSLKPATWILPLTEPLPKGKQARKNRGDC